jgi:CRP-like cAMP-binding protein
MDKSVISALPLKEAAAGEVIIEQDRPEEGLYFLETGTVDIQRDGIHITEIHEPGAIFGEMSYLLKTVPMGTVRAKTDCRFRYVDNLESYLQEKPELMLYIAEVLAHRLNALSKYLVEIKRQFQGRNDHFGMIDEVLKALVNRSPRAIPERPAPSESNPPIPGER